MSGADNLGTSIGDVVFGVLDDEGVIGAGRLSDEITTQLLAVLSSHPEAVLSLLGTVRKGWQCGAVAGRIQFVPGGSPHPWDDPRTVGPCRDCTPSYLVSLAETAKDDAS